MRAIWFCLFFSAVFVLAALSVSVEAQPVQGLNEAEPVTKPSRQIAERERPLSDGERLILEEYRLTEKVESRVFGNLRSYGAILGLALALMGFFGFQVVVDAITRRVEKRANDDLEAIRKRSQTALVDLELAVREGKGLSDTVAGQLETLRLRYAELEDLNSKYQELNARVQVISRQAEAASTAAATSQEKADSLGVALSNTFSGSPAIFTTALDWATHGSIGGKNFGDVQGRLILNIYSQLSLQGAPPRVWKMKPIEISGNLIRQWTDTNIDFSIPDDLKAKLDNWRAEHESRWDKRDPGRSYERTHSYHFVVERADGVTGAQPKGDDDLRSSAAFDRAHLE